MTIIIGVSCGDALIVASDSQTSSAGPLTSKRLNADKIFDMRFKNAVGLVGMAGSVTFASRAVEITQAACLSQTLSDYRQLAESAEKSVREVDRLIVEPYSMETQQPRSLIPFEGKTTMPC